MRTPLFSKYYRRLLCGGMLLLSLALRLWLYPSAAPAPVQTEAEPPPAETAAQTEEPTAPTEAAVPAMPFFTDEEASAIPLRGNCAYAVDKQALLQAPLPFSVTGSPQVLILHTHSSEAYTPTAESDYVPSAAYRTLDETRSVIAVGDALEAELTRRGIGVVHDRSCHDYPDYNGAYADAKTGIEAYLAAFPSVVLVLDVHRDALETPTREAAEVDGVDCAKLMLVVGTDEGGLYHPFWQDNLSCALKLHALLTRTEPALMRPLQLRKERFNGQTSSGAFIVEVGSTGNTLEEAINSMPYLADGIAALLDSTS